MELRKWSSAENGGGLKKRARQEEVFQGAVKTSFDSGVRTVWLVAWGGFANYDRNFSPGRVIVPSGCRSSGGRGAGKVLMPLSSALNSGLVARTKKLGSGLIQGQREDLRRCVKQPCFEPVTKPLHL